MEEKNRFYQTLKIIVIILISILIIPSFILLKGKEVYSYKRIREKQINCNSILGFKYKDFNDEMNYKLHTYLTEDYEVIALGNSRVMSFREELFLKNKFYNLGGVIQNLEDYNKFLDLLDEKKYPKVLIVSMDHFFFNDNYSKSKEINLKKNYKENIKILDFKRIKKIYKDLFSKKKNEEIKKLFKKKSNNIGISAILTGNGFRKDGSYYYKTIIEKKPSVEEKIEDSLERIKNKNKRFEEGKEISQSSLEKVDEFLKKCREKNIEVIGFLPPYSDLVLNKMREEKEKYVYIFSLEEILRKYFEKEGYQLYNFTSIEKNGGKREEIIDGFHGSEVFYLRIFLKMLENNKKLKKYSQNIDKLKKDLKNTKSEYEVNFKK